MKTSLWRYLRMSTLMLMCGLFSITSALAQSEINDYVLHEEDGLKFMSWFSQHGPKWCEHVYVSVIAEYESDENRASLLTANPATYLQEHIIPSIKEICPAFPNAAEFFKQIITLRFRPEVGGIEDESLNPDRLSFKIDDQGKLMLINDLAYKNWRDPNKGTYAFEQETLRNTETKLAAAKQQKEREEAILNSWTKPCSGAFCDLPDGIYFQAILDGDIEAIKLMDAHFTRAYKAEVDKASKTDFAKVFEHLSKQKLSSYAKATQSVLPYIADIYMKKYGSRNALQCPDNLITETYTYDYGSYESPDYKGLAMADMEFEQSRFTYRIPAEFSSLCDTLCDGLAENIFIDISQSLSYHPPTVKTMRGVDALMRSQHCSSSAIKSFEKNLISFTQSYLDNKKDWLDLSDVQPVQTSVEPELAEKPAPVTRNRQQQINAAPTPHQNQSATNQATTENQMSEAERYEKMNAEIAALSETYNARLNRLNAAFQKMMQKSFSAEEKSEMLRSFQEKLAALNAEAERETQKIKDKYKNM